jgi:phospholipid transport system substrate-binding protein
VKGRRQLRIFAVVTALAGLTLTAARGVAAPEPEILLRETVGEVLEAAYPANPVAGRADFSARALPILDRAFDFSAITRRAIGPGWRQFSDQERQRSIRDFRELVVRTYASRIRGAERPRITYGPPARQGEDRCEIPTQLIYDGGTYAVDYRMERRAGVWRVTDVVIEGVSFVSNYRAQFDGIMQRGGSSAVIQAMESRLARNPEGPR